jgi:hypothetical protein
MEQHWIITVELGLWSATYDGVITPRNETRQDLFHCIRDEAESRLRKEAIAAGEVIDPAAELGVSDFSLAPNQL